MTEREAPAVHPNAVRLRDLSEVTSTQAKHIANAVLYALRRPATSCTPGVSQRFQVLGASSIPNGMPPLIHASWWLGRAGAHPDINLPEVGVMITEQTLNDAWHATRLGAWDDLLRVVNSRAQSLFIVRQHVSGSWYAERNPNVGRAGGAALTILDLACQAGHVTLHGRTPGLAKTR